MPRFSYKKVVSTPSAERGSFPPFPFVRSQGQRENGCNATFSSSLTLLVFLWMGKEKIFFLPAFKQNTHIHASNTAVSQSWAVTTPPVASRMRVDWAQNDACNHGGHHTRATSPSHTGSLWREQNHAGSCLSRGRCAPFFSQSADSSISSTRPYYW